MDDFNRTRASVRTTRSAVRPPKPKRTTRIRSSRLDRLIKTETRQVGPGLPPPGFLSAWQSRSEWVLYWTLAKIFEDPEDPRQPPFEGGLRWRYQQSAFGGRNQLGGQVIDFVVVLPNGRDIGLDLQGEYFHLATNPYQNALEAARLRNMARYYEVVTIHESRLIADPTGQQAIATTLDALGGRRRLNPRAAGTISKTRLGRLYGSRGEQT